MKQWAGNTIIIIFIGNHTILQYKKGLVSKQINTSPLYLCSILIGGGWITRGTIF